MQSVVLFKGSGFFSTLNADFIVTLALWLWWAVYYHSQCLCAFDQQLLSSATLSEEKSWHIEVKCWVDEETEELTSLSQSPKAEMRVKTVGFFTSLQVREETKLVTPWTNHLPSWPIQFRGPPESPWRQKKDKVPLSSQVATTFFALPHTHCIQIQCLLPHKSWWSWRRSPTNRFGCTHCVPPQAAAPAAACLAWARGLRWGGRTEHCSWKIRSQHLMCLFVYVSLFKTIH